MTNSIKGFPGRPFHQNDDIPTLEAGKYLRTNDAGDGLEWDDPSAGSSGLPAYTATEATKYLRVSSDGTGVEWLPGASVITEAGTAITLTDAHFYGGIYLLLTSSSAVAVTVPSGLVRNEPLTIVRAGTGDVTVSAGAGATVSASDSRNKLRVQYSTAALIPVGSSTYILAGDIVA